MFLKFHAVRKYSHFHHFHDDTPYYSLSFCSYTFVSELDEIRHKDSLLYTLLLGRIAALKSIPISRYNRFFPDPFFILLVHSLPPIRTNIVPFP